MAKKGYSRMKKTQPAVMNIKVKLFTQVSGFNHMDLSQCASIVNRRFYRQGINWAVSGFTVINDPAKPSTGQITISSLPSTWICSNSWEKGFRQWQRQQNEALEDGTQESVKARFNDFKIFMNDEHSTAGTSDNVIPIDRDDAFYAVGEWDYSQLVIPNWAGAGGGPGVNYEPFMQMLGGNPVGGSPPVIGLIHAYENSRGVPQSPDPAVPADVLSATENIYNAMFDVGNNNIEVLENVVGKNDDLPYDQTLYPGALNAQSEFVNTIQLSNTAVSTSVSGG